MCRTATITVPAAPSSPSTLRAWTVDVLGRNYVNVAALAADAALIVTELASNSIRAGSRNVSVTLTSCRDAFEIAVTDTAPGMPELQSAAPDDASGWGLALVSAVSAEWGTRAGPDLWPAGGKTVWAKLVLTDDVTATFTGRDLSSFRRLQPDEARR